MKRFRPVLAALLILVGLSTSAVADDWEDCKQNDSDKAIAACTQIIGKAPGGDKQLAVAYTYRAIAYRKKGDYDRAFADYAKAVEIDPKYAYAYLSRGVTHRFKSEYDKAIAQFTQAIEIDPKYAVAYLQRGIDYRNKGDRDLAIADFTKAIELDPKYALAHNERGITYRYKGEYDKAIADCTKAIEINPKYAAGHNERGITYRYKGEYDKAIADYTKAIELDPKSAFAYMNRGVDFRNKGELDKAIVDLTKAIELDPKSAASYNYRGFAHDNKKDYDRAIADYSKALEIDAKFAIAYSNRGKIYETQGTHDAAIADYQKILALPATSATDRQRQDTARERIDKLTRAASTSTGAKRVALVVGNSDYAHAGILPNPVNDARAIAAALRRLGFAVTDHYDLTREKMGRALKDFGDRVEGAEWAVVFFAGHGLEINGTPYLVPIDAELKRDSHVVDEALSLSQVQAKLDAASKLGLVILDACRNNPFVSRMVRTGGASRSIGRGLSLIEPEGNVMVAYAAKHGTTAEDGSGRHSPFTEALLANIEEPGLEINFLFRKVRDQVREKTAKKQEPFLYGSLGSEQLYFKAAATR